MKTLRCCSVCGQKHAPEYIAGNVVLCFDCARAIYEDLRAKFQDVESLIQAMSEPEGEER